MATALTTIPDEQAVIAGGGLGLEDSSAVRPTPMILKQPTTEGLESVLPGQFVDKLSGIVFKTVKFVPLAMHPIRDKYPSATFVKDERPLCRSRNGITPITDDPDLVPQSASGFCKTCKHASWDGYNNKTKKGIKPSCKEAYLILFIEKETSLPFYIKVTGTSVKAAKTLKEAITRNAQIVKAKTGQMPNIFDYVVTMESKKGTDGPYYNIVFSRVDGMSKEEAQQFGPMYLELIRRKDQVQQELNKELEGDGEVVEAEIEAEAI